MARTIVISKPNDKNPLQLCEVELYGYPFVKPNILICKWFIISDCYKILLDQFQDQVVVDKNWTYFKEQQVRSKIECAVICKQTFDCITFTFANVGKCFFHEDGKGNYYVKN